MKVPHPRLHLSWRQLRLIAGLMGLQLLEVERGFSEHLLVLLLGVSGRFDASP